MIVSRSIIAAQVCQRSSCYSSCVWYCIKFLFKDQKRRKAMHVSGGVVLKTNEVKSACD